MCFPAGELITGTHDVLLGDVEGCPFFIDSALDAAWHHPELVLDVEDGEPEGFSLGPGSGQRFVTRPVDMKVISDMRPADPNARVSITP
jgi:uncharacterized protein (DUF779 family)